MGRIRCRLWLSLAVAAYIRPRDPHCLQDVFCVAAGVTFQDDRLFVAASHGEARASIVVRRARRIEASTIGMATRERASLLACETAQEFNYTLERIACARVRGALLARYRNRAATTLSRREAGSRRRAPETPTR